MHFRARYAIRDIDFLDTTINVSDQTRKIALQIAKISDDEAQPPVAGGQVIATATCQKDAPEPILDEARSSGDLKSRGEWVSQVNDGLTRFVLRSLRLIRWRTNFPTTSHNPILWGPELRWSLDGRTWKDYADLRPTGLRLEFTIRGPWTHEQSEFLNQKMSGELDEPFAHELLREAVANRKTNPRSSLVLAVAAAEIGFKQFVSRLLPDAAWLVEKLPSPELDKMLTQFPWHKLRLEIQGRTPQVPSPIRKKLKKAVELRNKVVHVGESQINAESLDYTLTSVRDLLYFLDALQGQRWALSFMSEEAITSLS